MPRKNFTIYYHPWRPWNLAASVLAIMVSWFYNHSFWWAIFHGMFAWIYLIYSLIIGRFANGHFMEIIHHYF
jgi:hypothetical protein